MLGRFDARSTLGRIRVPTRILVGAEDYATPVAMTEAMHQAIPGAALTILPGAAHLGPQVTAVHRHQSLAGDQAEPEEGGHPRVGGVLGEHHLDRDGAV